MEAVEIVIGSDGDDKISGDDAANLLASMSGDDEIAGGAGADTLWGGQGDNTMHGGPRIEPLDRRAGFRPVRVRRGGRRRGGSPTSPATGSA